MSDTGKKGHRQRLRDRFASGEEDSRSEEALLELLLTYAIPQKDVQPLAARLLSEHGSLSSLLEAPMKTLCQNDGVKGNSAVLLKLVDWIRRHYSPRQLGEDMSKPPIQASLFETISKDAEGTDSVVAERHPKKAMSRRGTLKFSNAVLKEAIQILPGLPDNESLDEIRSFLRANLHFSAEQTRQRYANYITRRMFPEGYADAPLRLFAKAFPNTQELRDVCFYRFLLSEPLEVEIIEDLLIPTLGTGRLSRERIRKRLSEKFPEAKSIVGCGKAIVDALTAGGIAKADRTKISFSYREISVASFGFVLHSEFPEPGMYDIRKLDENRMIRAMLWNPERLLHVLYELRNRGLISKVSEIDNIRQFTIKNTLAVVVEQIVSEEKKP
ncbi:DNA repair protein-like protein [uncultured Desulfatiglans sp.]|nr:DNA repair protein-like protein [uncultured Desulfatiglans sp.]